MATANVALRWILQVQRPASKLKGTTVNKSSVLRTSLGFWHDKPELVTSSVREDGKAPILGKVMCEEVECVSQVLALRHRSSSIVKVKRITIDANKGSFWLSVLFYSKFANSLNSHEQRYGEGEPDWWSILIEGEKMSGSKKGANLANLRIYT